MNSTYTKKDMYNKFMHLISQHEVMKKKKDEDGESLYL